MPAPIVPDRGWSTPQFASSVLSDPFGRSLAHLLRVAILALTAIATQTTAWALNAGSRIQATSGLNVRSTPAGALLGTQPSGAFGTIIAGPQTATFNGTSYVWWQVNWDNNPDGWSIQDGMTLVSVPAPILSSPTDGATVTGTSVTLSWNSVGGAGAYSVGLRDLTTNQLASIPLITGTSTTQSVIPGRSYRWDAASCISAGGGDNTSNCANRSGNRTFTVQTATAVPAVTMNPSNQTVNAGQVATFTAAASGTPTPTVQWQVSTNGGSTFTNISGATSAVYSLTTVVSQNGYRYRAIFTNSTGSATTAAAILSVNLASSAPIVTMNPSNQTVNAGQVATFNAAASGTPTPTVQWQVSTNAGSTFTNISGATSTTYSFTTTASQNGYRYRAVFTNTVGSVTTTAAILTENAASGRTVTVSYQPTPYPTSITNGIHILDGWVPSVYYGKTFQKDDKLEIGGWGDNYRTYLQFDLKGLPRNVSDATLMLYAYSPGGTSTKVNFNIQSPNISWIDASGKLTTSMTWATQPTGFSNVGSYPSGAYDSWWPMPITQTYNAWLSGSQNNGLAFFSMTQNNNFNMWRSSRYASDAYRPVLRLTFTPPVAVPDFKMPLPRNVSWLVTTEAGGWDCKGSAQDTAHADSNYFSVDFAWRNKSASGLQIYPMPSPGNSNIPISPAADGRVVEVGTNPLNGNYVVVSHDPSHDAATGFSTRYLHMDRILVNKGADVYRDTSILGYMGNTGQSTGPHLHFGIRHNNDGSATSNVMYAVVSGWLMKSFQSECSTTSDGRPIDWNRYYLSQ